MHLLAERGFFGAAGFDAVDDDAEREGEDVVAVFVHTDLVVDRPASTAVCTDEVHELLRVESDHLADGPDVDDVAYQSTVESFDDLARGDRRHVGEGVLGLLHKAGPNIVDGECGLGAVIHRNGAADLNHGCTPRLEPPPFRGRACDTQHSKLKFSMCLHFALLYTSGNKILHPASNV